MSIKRKKIVLFAFLTICIVTFCLTASAAGDGYLFVKSSVTADIYVDGLLKGKTPLNLSLPAGEHLVQVVRLGYQTQSVKVTIPAGDIKVVEVNLKPQTTAGNGTEAAPNQSKAGNAVADKWSGMEQARRKLAELNIPFTDNAYTKALLNNDALAVKLFIEAGKGLYVSLEYPPAFMQADQTLVFLKNHNTQGTPLEIAIAYNYTDMALMLLDMGVDANDFHKLNSYYTPIQLAVRNNNTRLVQAFLNAGADVKPALLGVSDASNQELVKWLIQMGADVNAKSAEGATVILRGMRREIFDLLVKSGADIHGVDKNQKNVLMYACHDPLGDTANVVYLLKAGLDVNAVDAEGTTALIFAVLSNKKDCVDLLIKSGAQVNIKNKYGKTALTYAKESQNKEVIELLKKAGAKG